MPGAEQAEQGVTVEAISFGHAFFRGERKWAHKLAVLTTSHHAGLYRNGTGIAEPLPKNQWQIHWTSPSMNALEAAAILRLVEEMPDDAVS